MAEEQIASGRINLDLNDKEVLAGLREVEAQFDRTMRDIDRQHASADIDANIAPLEDAVARAKRRVRELEGQKATVTVKAEKKQLDAAIKKARVEVKRLDGEKATIEIKYKSDTAALRATEARLKAIDAAAKAREAVEKKIEAERARRARQELQRINQIARTSRSLANQRAREMTQAERDAYRIEALRQREIDAIPKLQRRYAELAVQIDRLNAARSKVKHDEKASLVVDLKVGEAVAEMAALKATLIRMGKSPPDVEVAVKPGARTGETIRRAITDGFNSGGVRKAARDGGILIGLLFTNSLGEGIRRNLKPRTLLGNVGAGLSGIGAKILGGLGKLSDATVRIGPFTATIKQAVLAVSLLAPVILDVVGALGSLIAVAGSGVVGALGAGTAAAGAFGLVLGSTALLLPPLLKDYRNLNTMQNAYNVAVLKYGKNSDQAQKKLKEFNHAMKGVSPTAREAFLSLDKLQSSWRALSTASRPAFLDALGEGITTARESIKKFGPEITQSFGLVAKGVGVAAKSLRSFEAQRIFKSLFDDGQKALPSFGRGLANLAHAAGLVAVAFGHMLPSLGTGFEGWTKGILKATQNTSKLTATVQRSTESMRDIGHLAASSGKFLAAFFGAGVEDGQKFTVTMTNALNRWTAFLHTTQGQKSLHNFFSEAVSGAESLWATLAPLITSFVTWAASIAPFARLFLQGAAAISQMVAAFLKLTGLQSPIAALITTLGVLWGIGKVSAATRSITNFTRALFGMAAAQKAVAVSSEAAALGGGLGAAGAGTAGAAGARAAATASAASRVEAAALGATAARAAGGVGKLAKAGGIAKSALAGLGAVTVGVGSVTAGLGVVAIAAGAGMYLYMNRVRDWEKSAQSADKAAAVMRSGLSALDSVSTGLAQSTITLGGSESALRQTMKQSSKEQRTLNKMQAEGKTKTAEYRDLTEQHKNTLMQLRQAQLDVTSAEKSRTAQSKVDLKTQKDTLKAAQDNLKARRDSLSDLGNDKPGSLFGIGGTKIADAYKGIAKMAKEAGLSVRAYLKTDEGMDKAMKRYSSSEVDKVGQYAKKLDQVRRAAAQLKSAEDQTALSALNHRRALAGLAPIAAAAARSLALVAKAGGKSLATRISLKYDDPGQASKVAAAASRALQAGVKPARIRFIVENEKTAADAVRKIGAAADALSGKKAAIKLGASDQASATISKIINRVNSIKDKSTRIKAQDQATATIARIISRIHGVRDKTARLIAQDLISGKVASAQARINGLQGKTVIINEITRRSIVGGAAGAVSGGKNHPGAASGKRAGSVAGSTLIGEGKADEWHVDGKTGSIRKTNGPEIVRLGRSDAIIPTESAYRGQGRNIFKQIAKDLGLKLAAKGKAPAHTNSPNSSKASLTEYGKKIQRTAARKIAAKKTQGHGKSQTYIDRINRAKQAEDDQNFEIGRVENRLEEPASFIRVSGKDAQGNDLFELDTQAIYSWSAQLDNVRAMYDALLVKIQETAAAIADAEKNIGIIISKATRNSGILAKQMAREKSLSTRKGASPSERAAATQRYNTYKGLYEVEKKDLSDAREDQATIPDEKRELYRRKMTAADQRDEYKEDSAGIITLAQAELAAATPDPPTTDPAGGADGSGAGGAASDQLSYGQQAALADTERANVLREFGSNMTNALSAGMATAAGVPGSGPGAVNPASSSMGSPPVTGGIKAPPTSAAFTAADTASRAASSLPTGYAGQSSATSGQTVNKNVNIVNNFTQPPPDTHTFVKGMEFESAGSF